MRILFYILFLFSFTLNGQQYTYTTAINWDSIMGVVAKKTDSVLFPDVHDLPKDTCGYWETYYIFTNWKTIKKAETKSRDTAWVYSEWAVKKCWWIFDTCYSCKCRKGDLWIEIDIQHRVCMAGIIQERIRYKKPIYHGVPKNQYEVMVEKILNEK